MKSFKQSIAKVLSVTVLSTSITALPVKGNLFSGSVVYAEETQNRSAEIAQTIGTFVSEYKKLSSAPSQQKKLIEKFVQQTEKFTEKDFRLAALIHANKSGDMSFYYEYLNGVEKGIEEGNINAIKSFTSSVINNNQSAAWAGCGVGVAGAILLGAGVIVAIVGLSKKVNKSNIAERARQERQALTRKYEDDRYFIENSVGILQDEIDKVDLDIANAIGKQVAANTAADSFQVSIDVLLAAGADYYSEEVQLLVAERDAAIADANYWTEALIDLNELRNDLTIDLEYYQTPGVIANELEELQNIYDLAIQQNRDDEAADIERAPEQRKQRSTLLKVAGIAGVLGGIGVSSIGDCSEI